MSDMFGDDKKVLILPCQGRSDRETKMIKHYGLYPSLRYLALSGLKRVKVDTIPTHNTRKAALT